MPIDKKNRSLILLQFSSDYQCKWAPLIIYRASKRLNAFILANYPVSMHSIRTCGYFVQRVSPASEAAYDG